MGKQAQHVLNVRVLGMDANGHPIRQDAWTVNISRTTLVIGGLAASVNVGEVLSLQFKGRKVRYRVVWTGEVGTSKAGQLGLEQINPQDDLLQLNLPPEAESDENDQQERGSDRRLEHRYQASLPVEVKSAQGTPLRAEISDISLSGCYVTTLYPLEVDQVVNVVFWVGDVKISLKGRVRTCVLGVGCGIEFVEVPEQTKKLLTDFTQGCRLASDRRDGGQGATTQAEFTIVQGPSQYSR